MVVVSKSQTKNLSTFLTKTEPKPKRGSKLPILERLINNTAINSYEHPQKNLLNRTQILESIISEVTRLLSTRLSATAKNYSFYCNQEYGLGLPWMYGIPDFSSLNPADKNQWGKINILFENAITYFEPRLQNIKVSIDHFDSQNQQLYVSIKGQVVMKEFQQPVAFGVEIKNIN